MTSAVLPPSPSLSVAQQRRHQRLPSPYRPEAEVIALSLVSLEKSPGALDWPQAAQLATPWVSAVRDNPPHFWAMESLFQEYPISSAEGLALMRLAEALLRVPDMETAIALTADQLGRADFQPDGEHLLARLSSRAIALSRKFLPADADQAPQGLFHKLGARAMVAATVRAVQLLGRQFVLGQSIQEAMQEAAATPRGERQQRYTYDMLGEGARTAADAARYFRSYEDAIKAIAVKAGQHVAVELNDGISIKLSALHPRYEDAQRERVLAELVPRVWVLCELAAAANINLTIDAEEVDRLELSLDVFEVLAAKVAASHAQWQGFGLAVQAYQTRALALVQHVIVLARRHRLRLMVRLVKGAYWDFEIKRAQEMGLPHYPVFTHKHHTDLSYLACARELLNAPDAVYPQLAGHNAGTIAAVLQLAANVAEGRRAGPPHARPAPSEGGEPYAVGSVGATAASAGPPQARPAPSGGSEPHAVGSVGAIFELQRLHGMGEGIFREVLKNPAIACRVYAPVGSHRDLLAYLVRRLLENGANSSFVHQLADASLGMDDLLVSPLQIEPAPSLPLPADLYGPGRQNSGGVDLAVDEMLAPLLAALESLPAPKLPEIPHFDIKKACSPIVTASDSYQKWSNLPVSSRAGILRQAADLLQQRLPLFSALLVREAFKTWGDAVSEVREAVDFLRYYANEAERIMAPVVLPVQGEGVTGETNELRLSGRGVWVCISPWNFPLAIFTGQVAAALATGNAVIAKPAEQTPAIALAAVRLLHEAGVPEGALQFAAGPGETVGAALVALPGVAGVVFTGSTAVAKTINRALAAKDGPIVPLIAETGGINAMLVDSSALPEQVVDAVMQSAFRSAGERCSALRLLCVHESIADRVIGMIAGAASELTVGDQALLATDVGPLIDRQACEGIQKQLESLKSRIYVSNMPVAQDLRGLDAMNRIANLMPPVICEIASIADMKDEIFGPVLHIIRWGRGELVDAETVIARINALGFGLTLGIQTRIDSRAHALAAQARVGNVYINRNMIGAVVGVQPFGGEGMSGTGPKAGGPHYLYRFCAEQTVTVNTTAAGGNIELMT